MNANNNTPQETMFFHFCCNMEASWWQPNWMYSEINIVDFKAVLLWLGLKKCTIIYEINFAVPGLCNHRQSCIFINDEKVFKEQADPSAAAIFPGFQPF